MKMAKLSEIFHVDELDSEHDGFAIKIRNHQFDEDAYSRLQTYLSMLPVQGDMVAKEIAHGLWKLTFLLAVHSRKEGLWSEGDRSKAMAAEAYLFEEISRILRC